MGEFYIWVNFDKHEVLGGEIWGNVGKLQCSVGNDVQENDAVSMLLAGPWAFCRVGFFGDESYPGNFRADDENPIRRELALHVEEDDPYDWGMVPGVDVGGLFADARGKSFYVGSTRRGEPDWLPYEGPFTWNLRHVRYIVNESKHEFFDRNRGPVLSIGPNGVVREDTFTELCCSLRPEDLDWWPDGLWFGDVLWASDRHPGDGYKDITEEYRLFGRPCILSDEELLARYFASEYWSSQGALTIDNGKLGAFLEECETGRK